MDYISQTTHLTPLLRLIQRKQSHRRSSSPSPSQRTSKTVTFSSTTATTMSSSDTISTPPSQPTQQSQPQQQTMQNQPPTHQHTPPSPFLPTNITLLTQGAEALVYRTHYLTPSTPCALKYRPKKPWRHPTLDARLTRSRILAEARVLVKCRRSGVPVPAVLGLDWEGGWLALEWIHGRTVRRALDAYKAAGAGATTNRDEVEGLMRRVGKAVAGLHESGTVHGDLTTSNLMLRSTEGGGVETSLEGQVVLIDFGLAQTSTAEEDKAVDLYVLERAFASTHPEAEEAFKFVLQAYGEGYKGAKIVLKRLEDVRMRGRKKSMLG